MSDEDWARSLDGPCYYHAGLRLHDRPRGVTWRALQLAKARLRRAVVALGGDPEEIRYVAGVAPRLRGLIGG